MINTFKERQTFLWGVITFVLILAGLLLRLHRLTYRSLWMDEALCVKIAAVEDFKEMLRAVTIDIHPPLFYIQLHYWMSLFGNSDLSVRLFSVAWGCIGLLGIYFLCRYGLNWGHKASNIATLFAIILPIHVYYSQEVRPYILIFALSCFALGFLFRAHLTMKMRSYALFGLFQALVIYLHHTAIIYCFFINSVYLIISTLYKQMNRVRLKGIFLSAVISFFLYIPWLPLLLKQYQNPSVSEGFWNWVPQPGLKDLLMSLTKIIGGWKLSLPFNIPEWLYVIFLLPHLFLLFSGLLFIVRNQRTGESVLALSIVAYPLFIAFLSHVILPVWFLRILVPSAIGIPIIAMVGTQNNFLSQNHGAYSKFVIVLYVIISLIVSLNLVHTYKKENWREAANFLSHSARKDDSVLVYREYYAIPLERYIKPEIRVKPVRVERGTSREDLPGRLAEQVMSLSGNSQKIYLVLSGSNVSDNTLSSLMGKDYMPSERMSFQDIRILVFRTSSEE